MALDRLRSVRHPDVLWMLCLSFSLLTATARAQSSPGEILAELKGKPLFLRGLWRLDDLRFTHDGKPVQMYPSGPFTLAGIDVENVNSAADGLEIKGRRVGLEYGPKEGPRRVRLHWRDYSGKISIHIAGNSRQDFGPALGAVFAPDLGALLPSTQQYWEHVGDAYLKESDLDQAVNEAAEEAVESAVGEIGTANAASSTNNLTMPAGTQVGTPAHIGGSVKPPVLLSQVDPNFSDAARGMRYSGKVEVYLWVEPSGLPSHLRVVHPAGLGLDEEALAAVAGYRFRPATQNGMPVRVDLYVDVNFRIS